MFKLLAIGASVLHTQVAGLKAEPKTKVDYILSGPTNHILSAKKYLRGLNKQCIEDEEIQRYAKTSGMSNARRLCRAKVQTSYCDQLCEKTMLLLMEKQPSELGCKQECYPVVANVLKMKSRRTPDVSKPLDAAPPKAKTDEPKKATKSSESKKVTKPEVIRESQSKPQDEVEREVGDDEEEVDQVQDAVNQCGLVCSSASENCVPGLTKLFSGSSYWSSHFLTPDAYCRGPKTECTVHCALGFVDNALTDKYGEAFWENGAVDPLIDEDCLEAEIQLRMRLSGPYAVFEDLSDQPVSYWAERQESFCNGS